MGNAMELALTCMSMCLRAASEKLSMLLLITDVRHQQGHNYAVNLKESTPIIGPASNHTGIHVANIAVVQLLGYVTFTDIIPNTLSCCLV